MELKDDLKKAINENLVYMATSDNSGTPNVVPIGFCKVITEDTLLIADNFMKKTSLCYRNGDKEAYSVIG